MFVRLAYIPLSLFIAAIVADIIIINNQSKKMYNKFVSMKARQDKVNAANAEKSTENTDSQPAENNDNKNEENSAKNNK